MSAYYLEHASVDHIHKHFDLFEAEARRLLDLGLAIPAYVLIPSYYFSSWDGCLNKSFANFTSSNIIPYTVLGMISF